MKAFFRKVRLHFSNQPSTHARILKEISTVLSGPTVKLEDLKNLGGKLFKSSQLLLDEFLSIFPSVKIGSFPSLIFLPRNLSLQAQPEALLALPYFIEYNAHTSIVRT
jgi:hypothetical protein